MFIDKLKKLFNSQVCPLYDFTFENESESFALLNGKNIVWEPA